MMFTVCRFNSFNSLACQHQLEGANMKRAVLIFVLAFATIFMATPASAQYGYPIGGYNASLFPTASFAAVTFTAASQNGAGSGLAGYKSGVIQATGVSFTTGVWSIQGSVDGGTTWFSLPTASYPTTSVPITVTAVTQTTTTVPSRYVVSLSGLTNFRFITTSGTFTGTSLSLSMTATSNGGYL